MEEFEFLKSVSAIPSCAWAVKLNDGRVIQEGQDGIMWNNLEQSEIAAINVLGLAIPTGCEYSMHRTSMVSPGGQPGEARELVFKTIKKSACVVHRFVIW